MRNYPTGTSIFDLTLGDLNGDGLPDVVIGGVQSRVAVLLNDTSNAGALLAPRLYAVSATPAGGRSLGIAIGDISGDGKLDVVSGNYGPVFDLLLGNGDGTLAPTIPFATGPTPDTFESTHMAVADIGGDGLQDVVVGQSYQRSAQLFLHPNATLSLQLIDLLTILKVWRRFLCGR